jgi:hypothetical protein
MGDIIRRKKAIPVEALRADRVPETVYVPGPEPMPMPVQIQTPPAKPGVTQNIIYVSVPAGAGGPVSGQAPPAQPAPPSSPNQVHYHNHVHLPPRRRAGKGTSFLGTLGLVLGGISAGIAFLPPVMDFARYPAEAGAAAAGLGLLGAVLFRRVGRAVPLMGLIVCGIGYCLWLRNSGQIPRQYQDLIDRAIAPAVPAGSPQKDAAPAPASPPQSRDHSIFGDGSGAWVKPMAPPGSGAPEAKSGSTAQSAIPGGAAALDLVTATANLESARMAAATKMGLGYTAAKAAATASQAEYEQAKISDALGSPELVAASQRRMDADAQLKLIERQLREEPAVASAEQAVNEARAAGR